MVDIPKSLLLQHHLAVLETIGYWTKWKTQSKLKRKILSKERLYASIKYLPRRFLSEAMAANFSFELITNFTAMCLNFDRLLFCKRQKHFISSRPTVSANSRAFCTVSDASTQEDIWIRDSRWSNGFVHPFRNSRRRSTQELSKFTRDLPTSFVREWGFVSTPSSICNSQWTIIWLVGTQRCTLPAVLLYPVIPPCDFWCIFMYGLFNSLIWCNTTETAFLPFNCEIPLLEKIK